MASKLRVGTSGWVYRHWRGLFYPTALPQKRWLEHYVRHFDTVEINNSFYHLPLESTFEVWREQAPAEFLYAVKYSRYGTHMKKLRDPESHLERFLSRAEKLGSHLGPILVQLPPHWEVDPGRLDAFLEAAPKQHRWAVEFREKSWLCDEVYAVLEQHAAALCIHDLIGYHPWRTTSSWTYLRFHGIHYSGSYTHERLQQSADTIRAWLDQGRDVYAYFNNDIGGHALHNAQELNALLADVG
jgi:uncharacterized protein YecE (DUF72 family)